MLFLCLKLSYYAALCSHMLLMYMYNDGSVQNNRDFLYRALYCSSKSSTGSMHRPTVVARTVTDCSGLDMLSRES